MTSYDWLLATGTLGYFSVIFYGGYVLRAFPRCVGSLAVALLLGYSFIALLRLTLQAHWLHVEDAAIIAGAAPWVAFMWLTSHRLRAI